MASAPVPLLEFGGGRPDCGKRSISPQPTAPKISDDFNWTARDYDSIRMAMLEELAARFPSRQRWTTADLEVVLVEVLAAALDQLSDMADRVAAEAYLETARRPESVRRLLWMIGYDAVTKGNYKDFSTDGTDIRTKVQKLEDDWTEQPELMERARKQGPLEVGDQNRMVTVADYSTYLERHPLVRHAAAQVVWSGSWLTIQVALVLPWPEAALDTARYFEPRAQAEISAFNDEYSLPAVDFTHFNDPPQLTPRLILAPYVQALRMAGQEVVIVDAAPVGILIELTVEVESNYFQSEVGYEVGRVLGNGADGFFAPGQFEIGEDVHSSDVYQALLALEGVSNAYLMQFKRFGGQYPDHSEDGLIRLDPPEVAVCDNDPQHPERGNVRLHLVGGRKG